MYKRRKYKNRIKSLNFIIVCITIIMCMAIGYSFYSETLNIQGKANSKYNYMDLIVEETGTTGTWPNKVTRYTTSSNFKNLLITYWRVKDESFDYENHMVTTNINREIYQTGGENTDIDPDITLILYNTSDKDFIDGEIQLVSYYDNNDSFYNVEPSIIVNKDYFPSGSRATIKVNGSLRGNKTVSNNSYYLFRVTYQLEGHPYVFWYKITLS